MNVISFPNLGFTFNVNPVAFPIGEKPIYWYALIILAGVAAGLSIGLASSKKRGVDPDNIYDICLYGLLAAIIGARIYYVAFDFDSFKDNISDIFKVWEGGLAIYGGLIGAVIAAIIYCKVKKLNFFKIADIAAPGLILGQAIGRYGNFFNAEVYGFETTLPWGMSINGASPVHPLFLYESMWNILGLILILLFRDKKKAHGQVFFSYILWYSFGRFFLEGMRQPEYVLKLTGNIGVSQILAAVLVIVSIIVIVWLGKNKKLVPIDSIIFDLDGTMWDSTKNLVQPWNEVFTEYNLEKTITHEDIMSVMGLTLSEIGEVFIPEVPKELREEIVDKASEREAVYLEKLGGNLYPELKETLAELKKNYKLYIVSNCEDDYLECFLSFHNTREYFLDFEFSGRTGKEKSENIKILAERNELKNPIYVGDTEKDMKAAEKAGVKFLHAAYGFGKIEDKNVKKLEEIKLLPQIINMFE